MYFMLGEIYFPLVEDEKPWLFETLAYNHPPREPRQRSDLLFSPPQPIEMAQFAKINASKRCQFTSV